MFSLYKLITKTNIKSPTLAFPLVMPLIFVLLYSVGIPDGLDIVSVNAKVALFFTTILSITTMQSGLMGFGLNFISIKKSVMLKRIGATELSKTDVIIAVLLWGLTLWVISLFWIIAMVSVFSGLGVFVSSAGTHITDGVINATTESAKSTMFGWTSYINWGRLTLATFVMLYASYGLGVFFTSVAKDDQMYMGMAMFYFFLAGFIGGLMFPSDNLPEWMGYIAYFVPHSYIKPIYMWAGDFNVTISSVGYLNFALGIIVPIVFGTLITIAGIKMLKFD